MIKLGPMDRTGLLYSAIASPGLGGAVVYAKTLLGQIYLTQEQIPSRTRLHSERDVEQTDAVFVTRWFDGLTVGMIIDVEGHSFRITTRDELGRREGWRIYCREVV